MELGSGVINGFGMSAWLRKQFCGMTGPMWPQKWPPGSRDTVCKADHADLYTPLLLPTLLELSLPWDWVQLITLLVSPMWSGLCWPPHPPRPSTPLPWFTHLSTHQIFQGGYLMRCILCVNKRLEWPSWPLFLLVNLCTLQVSTMESRPWGVFSDSAGVAGPLLHDNFKPCIFSHLVYMSVCLPAMLLYHVGAQKVLKRN